MAKILVVEDDALISRMYQKVFESEGYEVFMAEDGQVGLDLARTKKPTIILLDIMMPKLNGLQMLQQLKADPILPKSRLSYSPTFRGHRMRKGLWSWEQSDIL